MFESELELQADCVELFPALHVCLFTLSPGVKQLCQNFSSVSTGGYQHVHPVA